jgi:hypothetical protein
MNKKNYNILVGGPFDGMPLPFKLPVTMIKIYTDDAPPEVPKDEESGTITMRNGFVAVYDEHYDWGIIVDPKTGMTTDNSDELSKHMKEGGFPLVYNTKKSGIDNEPLDDDEKPFFRRED